MKVVDVSIQDCDAHLAELKAMIVEKAKQPDSGRHLILNFGVAAHDPNFRLENRAKNILDFRCPDERGN